MSAVVGEQVLDRATVRQSRVLAIFSLFVGAFICLVFARGAEPGQMVTFGMNPGRTTAAIRIPDVTLPVLPTLYALAAAGSAHCSGSSERCALRTFGHCQHRY